MKRLLPSGLILWLENNTNVERADLFQILLPNGQTINATSGQWDITVKTGTAGWVNGTGSNLSTTTFYAEKYGRWERGAITIEGSSNLNSNSMSLSLTPEAGTMYPGLSSVPILNAALNGMFDAATVTVWTAYMPLGNYGNVSNGIETKFYGQIAKINDIDSLSVEFDVADPFYLLGGSAGKVPRRLYKPDCPWNFGDANCGVNLAGTSVGGYHITQAFTAASGSTQWILAPATAFSQPAGYFTQGIVTCTSGANGGLSWTVKLHDSSGYLELMNPMLLPPNAGDSFSVVAGCDRTLTTCTNKFNNATNFGGTPWVPPASRTA
jgi:uncharacterized phage protein (TIGR02218 family)